MIVYGDAGRELETAPALEALMGKLAEATPLTGIDRHGALASVFVEASELAQGIIDAEFQARGEDAPSELAESVTALLAALAGALGASWDAAFALSGLPDTGPAVARILEGAPPARITVNRAEGYAFYALYPEGFWVAGKLLAGVKPLRVVGIRSIGLGLAALVAAAAGAPPPVSVRPVGHPFARELRLAPFLVRWLREPAAHYAVVDEGPGLSGSSFAAVIAALRKAEVPHDHIHLFPSHGGEPGAMASPAVRASWSGLDRRVVSFDSLLLQTRRPEHRLDGWFKDCLGPAVAPLQDLSGGNWRKRHFAAESAWPPANPRGERRKYLLRTRSGEYLLRFSGLAPYGEGKLSLAQALSENGFSPPVLAFRHGFTAEPWLEDARPLDPAAVDRPRLVARLSRYLGFRARDLPAPDAHGASLLELGRMLEHNTREGLGEGFAETAAAIGRAAGGLAASVRRVRTDNRLHAWEWLQAPDGTLLKTDALDHAAAHDLVGCQDIAWDIAGAIAEFGLDAAERDILIRGVEEVSGQEVNRALLGFFEPCYLAFQLGAATLARDGLAGVPAETRRLDALAGRYRETLRDRLTHPAR